jgi:glycosyltransferase involved in cell wall biosynthesis
MENETNQQVIIAMPVYNGAKYLGATLDSLLGQTYQNIRLIIADNASTDETSVICRRYARRDKRVTYIRSTKNIGPYANFNALLKYAKDAELFMWAAHDDLRSPNFIQECMTALSKNPIAVMAFSNLVNIDSMGREVRGYQIKRIFPTSHPASYIRLYCRDGKANLIYGLWRGDKISTAYMQDHWGSDMNLVFEQLLKGKFVAVDKKLFYKRLSEQEMAKPLVPKGLLRKVKHRLSLRMSLLRDAQPYFDHLLDSTGGEQTSRLLALKCRVTVIYVMVRTLLLGKV